MENLKNFSSEFSKPFTICFDLLAKSNISLDNQSKSICSKLRSFVLVILFITFYCSLIVSLRKVLTGELGLYELAQILPVVIVITQGAMKGAIIISKSSKARRVIGELGYMWRTNGLTERQLTRKGVMLKRLNLCNAVFYWMNILGSWQYILMPLFETMYRTFVLGQDKMLFPFICARPFDATQNWMVYLVTYFVESYSMIHIVYVYLGVEFLMITLCSHLATDFELLQEEMLHTRQLEAATKMKATTGISYIGAKDTQNNDKVGYDDDTRNNGDNDEEDATIRLNKNGLGISDVIKRHQKLIMLSQLLNEIFNRVIFFNLLFATITICFFGFVTKFARDPLEMANNFVGVVASMIPIFNLCYYAEMLSGASVGVADSAYHNLWYKSDVPYQKSVIFIIMRAQRSCSLTSMGYSPVTLNTFTTVLSTTWSYFSLAISMYETE